MSNTVLPSWNDGVAKNAVVDFVTSAVTPGEGFVEIADRIAAFDNDGTLWSEQPLPPQFDFVSTPSSLGWERRTPRWSRRYWPRSRGRGQKPPQPSSRLRSRSGWRRGIYKENVIGTAADYSYSNGSIVRAARGLGGLDIGPGKPEHLFATTGRLPVFAGGNADVDIEMLETATFALLVDHDDDEREFAYTSNAEKSVERAKELGWTIVSVKDDWKTVFPSN